MRVSIAKRERDAQTNGIDVCAGSTQRNITSCKLKGDQGRNLRNLLQVIPNTDTKRGRIQVDVVNIKPIHPRETAPSIGKP